MSMDGGFQQRLDTARRAADLSWLALARVADIDARHMRRLAAGESGNPTITLVAQLAGALSVSPGWLAFGEGRMR